MSEVELSDYVKWNRDVRQIPHDRGIIIAIQDGKTVNISCVVMMQGGELLPVGKAFPTTEMGKVKGKILAWAELPLLKMSVKKWEYGYD